MHRFRKRSDVKQTLPQPLSSGGSEAPLLDTLPPVDDFRASLILPDLSRRFSLLRTSQGDPLTVDHLRTKFAQHRAQGSQNSISEEEEDMLLETLSRLRGKHAPERSQENVNGSDIMLGEEDSGNTSSHTIKAKGGSSIASSASSSRAPSKRYSNNLFGSGRLRDYAYMRTTSRISNSGSTKTQSIAPSEASSGAAGNTLSIADSLRPNTPPGTMSSLDPSAQSSPSPSHISSVHTSSTTSLDPSDSSSTAEYSPPKQSSSIALKRASMALESVIKEIEDEADEEIVMPRRSTPMPRQQGDHQQLSAPQRQFSETSTRDTVSSEVFEAGMAISSDKPIDAAEMLQRGPSPVPLNVTPGYIPGMPRPMTPRDFDIFTEEQRSHSTTPRATSPNIMSSFSMGESATASVGISKMLRRENSTSSNIPRGSPRPTTPLFLQRPVASLSNSSMNGRNTPADDRNRSYDRGNGGVNGENGAFDQEQPLSALLGRRRPASPLANSSFQPMSSVGYSISRPTTPSKITRPTTPSRHVWKAPVNDISPSPYGPTTFSTNTQHNRDDSWASDSGPPSDSEVKEFIAAVHAGGESDVFGNIGPSVGSVRKAANGTQNGFTPPGLQSASSFSSLEDNSPSWASQRANGHGRAASPLSDSVSSQRSFENASASPSTNGLQQRNYRSATPTQTAPRSAASNAVNTSPRTTRRASRQSASAVSPFDFGPIPSLTLNPRANLSSSSLESTGSSFHSWDDNNDKVLNVFDQIDAKPAWHDIPTETRKKTGSDSDDEWEADEIVMGYAGLRKGDFAAIQERLVSVARTTEHRGSALRKRRPSTSQSNYSSRDLRVASPPPSSPSANRSMAAEQQQKPAALDSAPIVAPGLSHSLSVGSIDSSTGLRRNLTQVLFGDKDEETSEPTTSPPRPISPIVTPPKNDSPPVENTTEASISELLQNALTHTHDAPTQAESTKTEPQYFLHRNPSASRLQPPSQDQAALALEVQQKVEAATAALKKPSSERLATVSRKRIDTSQISQPTLVSASTSVDAIPLKTPSINAGTNSGTSKIGSRFKKLRGSIRGKPVGETAVVTPDKSPLSASQTIRYDAEKLKMANGPYSSGLVELNRQGNAIASPPASAGPGLKGFMARFRGKRTADAPQSSSSSTQESPQILSAPLTAPPKHWPTSPTPVVSPFNSSPSQPLVEPDHRSPSRTESGSQPTSPLAHQHLLVPDSNQGSDGLETDALQQLFAAANKIGIDQSALNDLLVRSGSLSSKNMLARSASTSNSGSSHTNSTPNSTSGDMYLAAPPLRQPNLSLSSGSDHTATPIAMAFSTSQASGSNYGDDGEETEDMSRRQSVKADETLRRRNGTDNAVVRRTIIFVDPRQSMFDPAALKRASSKRRRTSVQSASNSNRSIHDRVPTPPPSKIPASKRFSHEPSPPVPLLPSSYGGQGDGSSSAPVDPSRPGVDSMYEYYGDGRAPNDPNNHDNRGGEQTGVELIELANGDTIWKIVNSLRDDDNDSIYSLGRNSFASEYSTHESGENMQVFVKEHVRTGSKGSQASIASRKKIGGGKPRPETKIMYSTPEHVAHLIEQISQGMDAGSFNFRPYHDSGPGSSPGPRSSEPGHSASSSLSANEITWTMKEIDHMLTAMSPTRPS